MTLPKFEGEIAITTATLVGTFAGSAITMPVGRYFLNSVGDGGATRSFCAELKNQLDSGPGGTWTVSVDDGTDSSLGKVTIARNSSFTATWSSATIESLLGFTADLTPSAATFTGANQAKYLYLPNVGRSGVMAPQASDGAIESDYTLSMGTDGTTYAISYSKRYVDSLELRLVLGQKTWNSMAVVTNEAFEQFYGDVISLGLRLRFHADRATDATYRTWVVEDGGAFKPITIKDDWTDSAKSLWAFRYTVRKFV